MKGNASIAMHLCLHSYLSICHLKTQKQISLKLNQYITELTATSNDGRIIFEINDQRICKAGRLPHTTSYTISLATTHHFLYHFIGKKKPNKSSEKDVNLGVIEPVPVEEPVSWCHRMNIYEKKNQKIEEQLICIFASVAISPSRYAEFQHAKKTVYDRHFTTFITI